MVRMLFSLVCVKCIFLWFCRSVWLERINKYAKRGITSAMECVNLPTFTFAMWQIRSCLLCEFSLLGARLFSFLSIFRILSQRSESSSSMVSLKHSTRRNAKCCWNLNTRTMLRILFSLLCVKCTFLWLYRSVRLEGINKYAKEGITSAMECVDFATFTFATWQIRSCLLCKFISLGTSLFSFPSIFCIVSLKEWIVELGREMKYLQAKQRTRQSMQGLRH